MDPDDIVGRTGDEELYDEYLDAALEGRCETPAEFALRHPAAGATLIGRIASLHAELTRERPPDRDALPFERLGEFRLLRRLGEGGMGTVYLAVQESLSRKVALKVVRADLAGSESALARFRREAAALARLRHENIVQVHAVGEDRGVRFIVMQYAEGRGLDEILDAAEREGRRPAASEAVRWAARIARALQAAHAAGIVHRDVKPGNVLNTSDGTPMLLDFGIARDVGAAGLTASAPFVGSPHYAAPEQIAGELGAADARTDVYSLGVTLYRCLAGRSPWRGETVEQVFREILAADAERLRVRVPTIARDLEIVVAKAMEREPSRRYATAAEFADDLEALLEFRPVRARRASPAERLAKWARRRPGPASAVATLGAALVVLAAVLVAQQRTARRALRDDAARTLELATSRIGAYRARRAASRGAERALDEARLVVISRFMEADEERVIDEQEDAVAAFRREREAAYHEVLDLVRRAESIDPGVAGAAAVRAELYLEKWREAVDAPDPGAAAYFREKLIAADPGGAFAAEVTGEGTLTVTSEPPGADVHLLRYVEQSQIVPGGDRRLVPAPLGGAGVLVPGTWAMEVVASSPPMRRGDLVLTLDRRPVRDVGVAAARELVARGGAAAGIVRDGAGLETTLPPGLAVRATAAPLDLSANSLAGTTPLAPRRVEPGGYLVVVRRPGFEDVRVPVLVTRAGSTVGVDLLPEGTSPPGFVRIEPSGRSGFLWIMEREVTADEYLRFLNDDATLHEIAVSQTPIRVPRGLAAVVSSGAWQRGADGRYELPPPSRGDWPVLGVSLEDARAFAAWKTARSRAAGEDFVFALPLHDEWAAAGHGCGDRRFVYGNRFRPKWASSCFSRRAAMPEPVLSYPIDESPAGAFDLSGSAVEWCDSWYDEGRGLHRLAGGSWTQAEAEKMDVWRPFGASERFTNEETGFRLVVRRPRQAK